MTSLKMTLLAFLTSGLFAGALASPAAAHDRTCTSPIEPARCLTAPPPRVPVSPITPGTYRIVVVGDGVVVDVDGESGDDGAGVIAHPWHGGRNQVWHVLPAGDGQVFITAAHSGKALSAGRSCRCPHGGAPRVEQQTLTGAANQRWRLRTVGAGRVEIESPATGLSLTAPRSVAGATRLTLSGFEFGSGQLFRFVEV